MSPDIKINDDNGAPLASVHISRGVAKAAALVLAKEVGNPTITLLEERQALENLADALNITAKYSPKRKTKKNP